MTSWANHHHHPWFIASSLKRKLSSESEEEDLPSVCNYQPQRKRLHKLERGLAGLTLHRHPTSPSSVAAPSVLPQHHSPLSPVVVGVLPTSTTTPPPYVFTQPIDSTTAYPSSIEEPSSPSSSLPDVPEVTMSTPSWYEPEKDRKSFRFALYHNPPRPQLFGSIHTGIVITNLDSDDSENEQETTSTEKKKNASSQQEGEEYTISPILLSALTNRLGIGSFKDHYQNKSASTSQALVIYRAPASLPVVSSTEDEGSKDPVDVQASDSNSILADDAMDIEFL